MRRLALVLVTVAGCVGDSPPVPEPTTVDTDPITPLLCTSGQPGDPTCPVNIIAFDELDATATFTIELLGSGGYFTGFSIVAGPNGLHLEHLALLVWRDGATAPDVLPIAEVIDIAPGERSEPTSLAVIGGLGRIGFRRDI